MSKSDENSTLLTSIPNHHPQSEREQQLDSVTLRALRARSKQIDQAIQAVNSRINYMKNKEQKTVKKVLNVKRKLTSLERIRTKVKDDRQQSIQESKRKEQYLARKAQHNKLIKQHLKYNKKIVTTLMNHKITEDIKNFKDKNQQLKVLCAIQRDNIVEQNTQKANKVRFDHIQSHEKRKMYFLDKLKQFKNYKEQKLKEEIRQRQRQESLIQQLQQKQRVLLQRLSNSQRFRMKCQQQYEEARKKYHSFYEATRGISRGVSRDSSIEETKADIFIS